LNTRYTVSVYMFGMDIRSFAIKLGLLSQSFASWNQICEWLRRFDTLRQAG